MALESIEALAVWTRLSESHCHPPREMRRSGSGRAEYRRAVAHRRKGVWMTSFQTGVVALKGWCLHHVVQQVSNIENSKEHHDRRAQARWRLTIPTARMSRIGMGQRRHPVRGCMLSTCDPSQKPPWAMLGSEEEARGKRTEESASELMQTSEGGASAEAVIAGSTTAAFACD
jgi:hypothetical protein